MADKQGGSIATDEPQKHTDQAGQNPAQDIRQADQKSTGSKENSELNGGQPDTGKNAPDQNENGEKFETYQPTSYQLGADHDPDDRVN